MCTECKRKKERKPKLSLLTQGQVKLLDEIEGDVIGAGELAEVVVDGDLALDDLLEHGLVLVNGPVLEAPGVGRQTNSALGRAQGGELAAVVGPIAAVSGGQSLLSSLADALRAEVMTVSEV